jgi:predicted phage tail protein
MQKVTLMGGLEQFGKEWHIKCGTIQDILKLIDCQTPGFRKYLIECDEAGLDIEIVRGSDILVDPRELLMNISDEDIFITIVPAGSKSKFLTIALSVVLFFIAPHASVGLMQNLVYGLAVNLAISGITQLMAPDPAADIPAGEDPNENIDKMFNGPVNVSKNGTPVPLLYGELVVGGAAISAEFFQLDKSIDVLPNVASIQDASVTLH